MGEANPASLGPTVLLLPAIDKVTLPFAHQDEPKAADRLGNTKFGSHGRTPSWVIFQGFHHGLWNRWPKIFLIIRARECKGPNASIHPPYTSHPAPITTQPGMKLILIISQLSTKRSKTPTTRSKDDYSLEQILAGWVPVFMRACGQC